MERMANEPARNSAGWYGTGDVPTYCHAGGGDTSICSQVNPTTIVITGQNGISK